jgi:hypothetical protein
MAPYDTSESLPDLYQFRLFCVRDPHLPTGCVGNDRRIETILEESPEETRRAAFRRSVAGEQGGCGAGRVERHRLGDRRAFRRAWAKVVVAARRLENLAARIDGAFVQSFGAYYFMRHFCNALTRRVAAVDR